MLFNGRKGTPALGLFIIALAVTSLTVLSLTAVLTSGQIQSGYSHNVCSITTRALGRTDPVGDAFLRGLGYLCASDSPKTAALTESIKPTLIQIIYTGRWLPPSPDPGGIMYWPVTGHLVMTDSEVDEISNLFAGKNIFEFSLTGMLLHTFSTTAFTDEPTGISYNPSDGHMFVSQDDSNEILEIAPGSDGRFWTLDDEMTSFSLAEFGVIDAEDVAYRQGKLFIADGENQEVWVIDWGPNGRFDGPPPNGDDTATHFDTAILGVRNPEGIAYDAETGHVWLCSKKSPVVEATITGALVRSFDISFVNPLDPVGITLAPGSNNSLETHLWIADRMVDNNHDPTENDGRVYEFAIGIGSTPMPTTGLSPTPTQTPFATNMATRVPSPSLPTSTPTLTATSAASDTSTTTTLRFGAGS